MLIVVCAFLTVAAAFYVLTPLFREARGNLEVELLAETQLDRLLNRKAIIYSNIKDLEFEYKMGRLSDKDFQRLETGYKGEAALILQELDNLGVEKDLDEKIESEVSARKAALFSESSTDRPTPLVCPNCSAHVTAGNKFCGDCGHRL